MVPESALRIPAMRLRKVVLPDPLLPWRATCSPFPRLKVGMSMTSVRSP